MFSKSHKKLLTGVSCFTVAASLVSMPASAQEVENELEEIVVTGIRGSLRNALDIKRNSSSIVDSISAEDIGKLPDENVAETLQRINGVQIQRRNGEGAGVSIRGLPQNRLQINGVTLVNPTGRNSGPGESTFPVLQFVPSELIAGIDVAKAAEANHIEGGIGGVVTLKTHRPLDLGDKIAYTAQLGYADRAEDFDPRGSVTFSKTFADETIGVLLSASWSRRSLQEELFFSRTGWSGQDSDGDGFADTNFAPGDLRYQTLEEDRERLGLVGTLQFRPSSDLEFYVDGFYSSFDLTRSRSWFSSGGSGGTDPSAYLDNSAVVDANGTIISGDFIQQIQGNGEDLTNNSETYNIVVGGEYNTGALTISTVFNYGKATQADDQDFARVRQNGVRFSRDFSGDIPTLSVDPDFAVTDAGNYGSIIGFSNDIDFVSEETSFQIDADYAFEGGFFESIDFGYRYADQSSSRRQLRAGNAVGGGVWVIAGDPDSGFDNSIVPNGFLETVSLDNVFSGEAVSVNSFLAANPHGLGGREELLNLAGATLIEQPDGTYSTDETINSGYAKLNFGSDASSLPFAGNIGVRVVETKQTSVGNIITAGGPQSLTVERSYTDVLPSLNLRFDLSDDKVLRFAASEVISRPPTADLRAGLSLDEGAGTASGGDPLLDPFSATALDLSFEWYMTDDSAFTIAAFYKDVSAFFVTTASREAIPGLTSINDDGLFLVSRLTNGQDGEIKGLELGYQTAFENGFGFQANYTFIDSKTPNSDPATGDNIGIEGLSKHSFNVIGFYEDDRFSARLAYNWRDEFLVATSFNGSSLSEEGRGQLDFSMSYNVLENLAVTFEAININNSRVRQFSVIQDRNFRIARTDRRFFVGLRGSF